MPVTREMAAQSLLLFEKQAVTRLNYHFTVVIIPAEPELTLGVHAKTVYHSVLHEYDGVTSPASHSCCL